MSALVRLGEVAGFDDERGLGTVRDDDGELFAFHCTAIAGGARTIPEGARVAFVRRAGRGGADEAASVVPLG